MSVAFEAPEVQVAIRSGAAGLKPSFKASGKGRTMLDDDARALSSTEGANSALSYDSNGEGTGTR